MLLVQLNLYLSGLPERITQEKLRQKEAMRDLEQYKQKDVSLNKNLKKLSCLLC